MPEIPRPHEHAFQPFLRGARPAHDNYMFSYSVIG